MILDTNALSGLIDKESALFKVVQNAPELSLPVIVLGEFRFGIAQSRHRTQYEAWLARDLALFRILSIEEQTTLFYADLRIELKRRGTPIPANDAWIAALARQHGLPIVSRDEHFDHVAGIRRLSW